MYKQLICEYCGDPAQIIRKVKQSFFPFKVKSISALCKDCHREIYDGKIPDVTGPEHKSRKGRGIQDRRKLE